MNYLYRALIILFIFNSTTILAREIVIITFDREAATAQKVSELIQTELRIPSLLISMRQKKTPCSMIKRAVIQICINNDGNMSFPVYEQEIVRNTLSMFLPNRYKNLREKK